MSSIIKISEKNIPEHDLQVIGTWKDVLIQAMNVQRDHVHLVCSISPKLSISEYIGVLKGKTAIKLFKTYLGLKQKPYWGDHFLVERIFCECRGIGREQDKALCEVSTASWMREPNGPVGLI